MKTRKLIGALIIFIIAISLLSVFSKTNAETASYKLGIVRLRESGYGYKITPTGSNEKTIWKIVSYDSNGGVHYDNPIYCIKAGQGFGDSWTSENISNTVDYNVSYDIKKDKETLKTKFNTISMFNDETVYSQVLWLLDNLYIPGKSTESEKQALLSKVPTQTTYGTESDVWTEMKKTTSELDDLTDDEIEVVQQLAIWYFTNKEDTNYNSETLPTLLQNNVVKVDAAYKAFGDKYDETTGENPMQYGGWKQDYASDLYKYLITEAKKHTNYTGNTSTKETPLKINKNSEVTMSEDVTGANYIVGPFKIDKISNDTYIDFTATFKDQNENEITNYSILDETKTATNSSIENLIGNNFYISIPKTSVNNLQIVKFSISLSYAQTKITFLTSGEATYRQDQPVVIIEKTTDDYTDSINSKTLDLALRKFITEINGIKPTVDRKPIVDTSTIKTTGTATYKHVKAPLSTKIGEIVTYTIRVYNEGDIDGYVSEITDFLPEYLEFITQETAKTNAEKEAAEFNTNYLWEVVPNSNGRRIKTTVTSKEHTDTYSTLTKINRANTLLTKFDGGDTLSYIDVQVKCKVKSNAVSDKKITNIAEITGMTDVSGNIIKTDRDSTSESLTDNIDNNGKLPTDAELPEYIGNTDNKNLDPKNPESYFKGQEDDDDFEKLEIQIFDLALKKFITEVNDTNITDRIPTVTKKSDKTLSYSLTPAPLGVQTGDYITYTIRIYNEGEIDGYAKEITDDLPEGLEFLPANSINKQYRWIMRDENGNEVDDVSKAKIITTDYLSKDVGEKANRDNLIKAYQKDAPISEVKPFNPDYKEIEVVFKVIEPNTSEKILVNVAQISEDEDKDGNPVEDIDSIPNRDEEYDFDGDNEDDIDYEHVKLLYFDLALRKFITEVDDIKYNNRYPELSYENGKITYNHTKEPVRVENGNVVIYTIRIFNEGRVAGYAKEVVDDIPEGLEFLPDHEINKEYGWKMYYEAQEEGMYLDYKYGDRRYIEVKDEKDAEKAKESGIIVTEYLSKEAGEKENRDNLIKAFDEDKAISTEEPYNPDYRDIKVAFKVTEPNTSDRIIINTAEISEDEDEDGRPVEDIDSTPGNEKEDEDDIDKEFIYVKYFDLSLLKWVTQAIVTVDGKTTVTETGHTGEENPEPVVKVEIKEKNIKKVNVKFKFKIRVTNEGEIAGYAKEVTDYIPEGLEFIKEDNTNWYVREDGVVATDQLADVLLMPGESSTVEIILTWINDANNMGLKTNIAEISKDYNDSHTPDIDSTPDNKKPGEDDIDDAPVILSPQTGETRIYYILGTTILLTMVIGIALIKKYVL